jgi:hypothetical protein
MKKWLYFDCKSAKKIVSSLGKKSVREPRHAKLREHNLYLRKYTKYPLRTRHYNTQLQPAMETMADQNPKQYWKHLGALIQEQQFRRVTTERCPNRTSDRTLHCPVAHTINT